MLKTVVFHDKGYSASSDNLILKEKQNTQRKISPQKLSRQSKDSDIAITTLIFLLILSVSIIEF